MSATGIQLQQLQPHEQEQPGAFADRLGQWYLSRASEAHRRKLGQYFTPVEVARFMARMYRPTTNRLRVLDPGAGAGILACALCESLAAASKKIAEIELEAYETDDRLADCLNQSLRYAQAWLRTKDIALRFNVRREDFVLRHARILADSLLPFSPSQSANGFDLVIANPPYFKLQKDDPRAQAAAEIVCGQPNIYAVFMALSAELVREGGELIFITPRSYTAGPYFQQFREHFFRQMRPIALHLFDSRRAAFSRDEVLQENLILQARRTSAQVADGQVSISWSAGTRDLSHQRMRRVSLAETLDLASKEKMLRIPLAEEDDEAVKIVQSWKGSLHGYGLQISTGPVVPFRALPLISQKGTVPQSHVPLLWMQNVSAMRVEWPVSVKNKEQYISLAEQAQPLLVKNQNYVLLRRFSAKEAARRLIAAPYLAKSLNAPLLGLENHLNYVYRPGGALSEEEACGLAALLNSALLDRYFRIFNGNTQVSATELRTMPLPSWKLVLALGKRVMVKQVDLTAIDGWVDELMIESVTGFLTRAEKRAALPVL
jgi:adenine-specific DNA-methyltransferase